MGTVREPDGLSAFGGVLFSWSNSLSACGGPFSMPEQPWVESKHCQRVTNRHAARLLDPRDKAEVTMRGSEPICYDGTMLGGLAAQQSAASQAAGVRKPTGTKC